MKYCGRDFSSPEINDIGQLIAENPQANRRWLSKKVCEFFGWLRPAGLTKEMSCRVAMIRMHKDGLIQLPLPQSKNGNGKRCARITPQADPPLYEIQTPVGDIKDLQLELVTDPAQSLLWNEFIDRYHYLGYTPMSGTPLRYFAKSQNTVLAILGFDASAWMTAPRDKFIGWNHAQRQSNLHLVVNNARFLILPWVHSTHQASRLLGMVSRQIAIDWQNRYSYRPVIIETFDEIPRFKGTAYKAANWIHVGQTQGRGKLGQPWENNLPIKKSCFTRYINAFDSFSANNPVFIDKYFHICLTAK
jgi:hypothetical protein